jgi:thiol-disulfide isomerase/thioredoxin
MSQSRSRPICSANRLALALAAAGVAFSSSACGSETAQTPNGGAPEKSMATDAVDAKTAYELIVTHPYTFSDDTPFQVACRDFCARFPGNPLYAQVRQIALVHWEMSRMLHRNEATPIPNWDPTDAERDPRLTEEQRTEAAIEVAHDRAHGRESANGENFGTADFDEVSKVAASHLGTDAARQNLIRAALMIPPERAIQRLKEIYPTDSDVNRFILLLDGLGKPCAFDFIAMDGRRVNSRDYQGKVVLVDFWAKGCGPCVSAMPDLKKLAEAHRLQGFEVVGVNMDYNQADAEAIVQKFGLPWPQQFDGRGWGNALARRFFVTSIPRGMLIDRQGRLRYVYSDPRIPETVERIEKLLAEN